ncbi:MAG: hypothetical protein ABIC82_02285 [bacterium]
MKKSSVKTKEPLIIAIVSIVLLSGIFAFAPRKKTKETSGAVPGSPQSELTPSASDLFSCGGRNDCDDDTDDVFNESQHKYVAQAYDKFGFPLSGVKYKWTQDDTNDLIKFRELNPASGLVDQSNITASETDQEIYVQPNEANIQNGEATVNVLGYIGTEEQGQSQSIDVNLYFCLNSWPSTATFPFADNESPQSAPYTNFETFYCKDRGNATNQDDDYAALKAIQTNSGISYLCSRGGGDSLKCDRDYYIKYDETWTKDTLNNLEVPTNISSPDAVGLFEATKILATKILVTEGNQWAYYDDSSWTSGNITSAQFPSIIPADSWPDGPVKEIKLQPTAIALETGETGDKWFLIEGNFYAKNDPGNLLPTSAITNLAEAGWPADVQFPDDVAWWNNGTNNYLLALKNNYYRIYSKNNFCNAVLKCETPAGREWGSCNVNAQCYWGELFSLYDGKELPASIAIEWKNNIKFPIKTIGLHDNNFLATSSCEYSSGICFLKQFLLIANPACNDGIDNDNDETCDWQNNICGKGINKDPDCTSSIDNSESGTCDDGIDNDNDKSIDYPDDFSCDSYSYIEEDGCANGKQCCDNTDNDSDGLIDQSDSGCDNKTDNTEANLCADNTDNDSDGLIDLFDPGCLNAADNDEKGDNAMR